MEVTFAGAMDRKQVMRLRDLNSGFSNPRDDLAGLLPGVAAGRAHRGPLQGAGAARAGARVRRRPRHRAGDPEGADGVDRRPAEDLRRLPRRALRPAAPRAGDARGLRGRRAGSNACGRWPSANPGQLPGAAGARARARGQRSGRGAGRLPNAPRRSCRSRPARAARRRASPRCSRRSVATRRGAARGARSAHDHRPHRRRARRAQLVGLLDRRHRRGPAQGARSPSWWRSIRSTPPRIPSSAASRWPTATLPAALQAFRVAVAAGSPDRAGAHADLGEALEKTGARDDAKRQALLALEVAPTYVRAQDLLLRLVEPRQ